MRPRGRRQVEPVVEALAFDPETYPRSKRLKWRYAPETMPLTVSAELAAQLEAAAMAWITRHARSSFGERMVCEPALVDAAR